MKGTLRVSTHSKSKVMVLLWFFLHSLLDFGFVYCTCQQLSLPDLYVIVTGRRTEDERPNSKSTREGGAVRSSCSRPGWEMQLGCEVDRQRGDSPGEHRALLPHPGVALSLMSLSIVKPGTYCQIPVICFAGFTAMLQHTTRGQWSLKRRDSPLWIILFSKCLLFRQPRMLQNMSPAFK